MGRNKRRIEEIFNRTLEVGVGGEFDRHKVNDTDEPMEVTGTVTVDPSPIATDANIINLSLPVVSTEVSQGITDNTKILQIRARGLSTLQFTFVATESGTKFLTIPVGTTYTVDSLDFDSKTLYIQSDVAGEIVEIVEYI